MVQNLTGLAISLVENHKAVLASVVSLVAVLLLQRLLKANPLSHIPIVGLEVGNEETRRKAYLSSSKKFYLDGYQKFKDGLFRVTSSRRSPIVVISPKYLAELKSLPDDVLSMDAAVDETLETRYTKVETHVPLIPHTIKTQLTPSLVRLNPAISEEVSAVLRMEIPPTVDWTEVNIHKKLLRMVAMVSGRVFVGPELCRDEQYIDVAINYTTDLMIAQRVVQMLKPWQRFFLASRLPYITKLQKRIEEADAFLRPVVTTRRQKESQPGYEKPDDMLQWLMDGQEKFGGRDDKQMAKFQLGISFAAIHTTTLTATNAFYNLAAIPELVPELRDEIRTVLAENSGVFTSLAMQNMKKLDSFLKETLRSHPVTFASFQRKVLKPFTLSNGQEIPAGITIEAPAYAVNYDPNVFPDCDRFDAFRFYRLRQQQQDERRQQDRKQGGAAAVEAAAQNQFVSVSLNSLTFGYGRHACPGRFFAANEIKMIVAMALLRYDMKLAGGATERYPNVEFAHMSIPDPEKTLLFREAS